jgi:hypothetical protein
MNALALFATTLRALILSPPKCKKIICKYRKLKMKKVMTSLLYFIFDKNIPGDGGDGNYIRWEIKCLFYFCDTSVQSFGPGWNHTVWKPRGLIVGFKLRGILATWFGDFTDLHGIKEDRVFKPQTISRRFANRSNKSRKSAKWCKPRAKA